LTSLWKIEEKKYLTKSEHSSRKHPATESEKNLRKYFIATTVPLAHNAVILTCFLPAKSGTDGLPFISWKRSEKTA